MSRPLGAPVRFDPDIHLRYDGSSTYVAGSERTALSEFWNREEQSVWHAPEPVTTPAGRIVSAATLHFADWDWAVARAIYDLDCGLVQIEPEPRAELCEEIAELLLAEARRCRRMK